MKPLTQYAKSGNVNIAYQVAGQGPVDLIYIPGWVSNIDMMWKDPKIAPFLMALCQFTRLIVFDKRGTGLSDRVDTTCTLEVRMDDIRCILDAVASKKAILFGHSEGGTIACLFAATYPERIISLITFGIFAKRKYSIDYPWAPKAEERKVFYDTIKNNWGNSKKMGLEWLMPSLINDKKYYDWFSSYLRSAASPGAALALAIMNTEADVTNVLHTIKSPTLVIHRTNDKDALIEEGKYLANLIPNSRFVELPGVDHLFWVGDSFLVLAEIEEFITGTKPIQKLKQAETIISKNSIIEIENIMMNNFNNSLKIEEFAKLCGKSLSTFKRDFIFHFKTTPYKWLKEKRLEYAKSLLLKSDLNVNQISYECGFKNNSHFIQAFKEKYKSSPNQYKIKYLLTTKEPKLIIEKRS